MEYHEHGDLRQYMKKPFPEMEARMIISQVLEGVALMHDNDFAHRDLKPAVSMRTDAPLRGYRLSQLSLALFLTLTGRRIFWSLALHLNGG